MKLVEHLQGKGVALKVCDDRIVCRGPAEVLTPTVRRELANHKREVLAYLAQSRDTDEKSVNVEHISTGGLLPAGISLAEELHQAIREAREWPDLEKALGRAQIGYKRNELKVEEVEALALLAVQRARTVPEKAE